MSLLQLRGVELSYGHHPLLDHADLVIEQGERIALVGRNGCGKSTLLRVITGEVVAEEGVVERGDWRIARLPQEVPTNLEGSLYTLVAAGLGEIGEQIAQYHRLSLVLATTPDEATLNQLSKIQQQIEAADGWSIQQRVETTLSQMGLDPEQRFETLSGGMKRRVLLAQALVVDAGGKALLFAAGL